jgi:hypothetical protein
MQKRKLILSVLSKLGFVLLVLYLASYHFRSITWPGEQGGLVRSFPTEAEAVLFLPAAQLERLLLGKHVETFGFTPELIK